MPTRWLEAMPTASQTPGTRPTAGERGGRKTRTTFGSMPMLMLRRSVMGAVRECRSEPQGEACPEPAEGNLLRPLVDQSARETPRFTQGDGTPALSRLTLFHTTLPSPADVAASLISRSIAWGRPPRPRKAAWPTAILPQSLLLGV